MYLRLNLVFSEIAFSCRLQQVYYFTWILYYELYLMYDCGDIRFCSSNALECGMDQVLYCFVAEEGVFEVPFCNSSFQQRKSRSHSLTPNRLPRQEMGWARRSVANVVVRPEQRRWTCLVPKHLFLGASIKLFEGGRIRTMQWPHNS